jgi:dolichol-phosphate mannosyltransferase
MQKVSIVIPVFNNESTIAQLFTQLSELFSRTEDFNLEVIFVDDRSSDNSLIVIKELKARFPNVKYLHFSKNYGQVVAITAGLKKATGDAVILRSADLQDSVELIESFLRGWKQGNKVVIGNRKKRSDGIVDRMQSKLFYNLIRKVSPNMPEGGYDYCLLDRSIVSELNKFNHRNRFLQGDILSLGFQTLVLPYERKANPDSKQRGKQSLSSNIKYSVDGIIDSTYLPIRMMSAMGVLSMVAGVVYSIIIVVAKLTGNVPFEGWAPLMILLLIIGGLIMLMLGIMGEYIWRIYDQLKDRPEYVIEEESD